MAFRCGFWVVSIGRLSLVLYTGLGIVVWLIPASEFWRLTLAFIIVQLNDERLMVELEKTCGVPDTREDRGEVEISENKEKETIIDTPEQERPAMSDVGTRSGSVGIRYSTQNGNDLYSIYRSFNNGCFSIQQIKSIHPFKDVMLLTLIMIQG